MSKEDDMIEKLILDGGLEAAGIDDETGEFLYSFTPKIKDIMPDLYHEHITDVNSGVMRLWEMGFVNVNLLNDDPEITLCAKSFDRLAVEGLSKQDRWNLFELMRLLKRKD